MWSAVAERDATGQEESLTGRMAELEAGSCIHRDIAEDEAK